MPPTVIFGDIRGLEIPEILPILQKHGITRLDSAAIYEKGDSERRLGEAGVGKNFTIDTKVLAGFPNEGYLTPEKISQSATDSLERLKLEKVNVLYVHGPDHETPVADQARGFNDVYKQGKMNAVGVSNLTPAMVQEWLDVASKEGYVKPTWYQGQYNLVCRSFEDDLFPLLRKNGMHFAAYSPLAGGFLNGNLTPEKKKGQRFLDHEATGMYTNFYDQPAMHDAFAKLQAISEKTGLPTDELSLRWIMHHSALQDNDILILGASKVHQIEHSLENLKKGPLDEEVAKQLNDLSTPELKQASLKIVRFFTK